MTDDMRGTPYNNMPLSIYIGDDQSKKSLREEQRSAGEVVSELCEKLGLVENQSCFGLLQRDSENAPLVPLAPDFIIEPQFYVGHRADIKRLYFKMLYYFLPTIIADDPEVCRFEFIQARENVLAGIYPIPDQALVELGSYALLHDFGPVKGEVKPNFLANTIQNYIPQQAFRRQGPANGTVSWDTALIEAYKSLTPSEPTEAAVHYLEILKHMPFYGMALFNCKHSATGNRRMSGKVLLGVSNRGLHFFRVQPDYARGGEAAEETYFWPYSSIFSWGRSPHTFSFITDEDDGTKYTLETKEGESIVAIIQGYIRLILSAIAVEGPSLVPLASAATGS